jgi:hypothetical protein
MVGSRFVLLSQMSGADIRQGPIVRINPYELHVNDPNFYDTVYAGGGKKRDKWSWFVRLYGMDDGALATVDHDLHRVRRAAINPFFSKSNVRKLENIIQLKASKVLDYMIALEDTGKPLTLTHLYGAFTSDVIVEYAFGESHNNLGKDNLNDKFFQMMGSIHHIGPAAKQFGWLLPILLSIPEWITSRLDPGMAAFAEMQNVRLMQHSLFTPCKNQLTGFRNAKNRSRTSWIILITTKTSRSPQSFTTCSGVIWPPRKRNSNASVKKVRRLLQQERKPLHGA